MFILLDGKPKFIMGTINGIDYFTEEERKHLLEVEFKDQEIEETTYDIDEGFKARAKELGKLNLTSSRSEFLEYLNGDKPLPENKSIEILKEQVSTLSDIIDYLLSNE